MSSFFASSYRATVFGLWGWWEFTHAGFQRASKGFQPQDTSGSLVGKSIIVTGANSGIGKQTALKLAQKGACVHLVCRDPVAGEQARQDILSQASPDARIELHLVDLSRPSQIRGFCDSFTKKYSTLDVLINNAGVLLNERVETPEALEKTFATNTLGTYLMTTLLLPILRNSQDPRVIAVSSGGMYNTALDTSDLQSLSAAKTFDGVQAYAQTKRAQVELTEYWAKTYPDNAMFVSMHPGWTSTPGLEKSLPGFHGALKDSLRTLDEGADTIVWAAMVPDLKKRVRNGSFLFDRKEAQQHLTWGGTQTGPQVVESLVKECDRVSTI